MWDANFVCICLPGEGWHPVNRAEAWHVFNTCTDFFLAVCAGDWAEAAEEGKNRIPMASNASTQLLLLSNATNTTNTTNTTGGGDVEIAYNDLLWQMIAILVGCIGGALLLSCIAVFTLGPKCDGAPMQACFGWMSATGKRYKDKKRGDSAEDEERQTLVTVRRPPQWEDQKN